MLDRPARPVRRAGRVSGPRFEKARFEKPSFQKLSIHKNAGHDIEAVLDHARCLRRSGREPGACAVAKASLLARVDRFRGLAVARTAAGLDLDEREHAAPSHDQIDLDAIGADVACDDAITSRSEMPCRGVFAETSERGTALFCGSNQGVRGPRPRPVVSRACSGWDGQDRHGHAPHRRDTNW